MTLPQNTEMSFRDIAATSYLLRDRLMLTQCVKSRLANYLKCKSLYLKLEHKQNSGCYKARGAFNTLLTMPKDERKKGIVVASQGNHGIAFSHAGKKLGIPVTVILSKTAPAWKAQICRKNGATVVIDGDNIHETISAAIEIAKRENQKFINIFSNFAIRVGNATVGLEMSHQVPKMDYCIVPFTMEKSILRGLQIAIKKMCPNCKICAVRSSKANSLTRLGSDGDDPIVDHIIDVSEEDILTAFLLLVEIEKILVEPSSAMTLAALNSRKHPEFFDKNVVCLLGNGNVDLAAVTKLLVNSDVLPTNTITFTVSLPDEVGALHKLCAEISKNQVSIEDIKFPRNNEKMMVFCETTGSVQRRNFMLNMLAAYPDFQMVPLRCGTKDPQLEAKPFYVDSPRNGRNRSEEISQRHGSPINSKDDATNRDSGNICPGCKCRGRGFVSHDKFQKRSKSRSQESSRKCGDHSISSTHEQGFGECYDSLIANEFDNTDLQPRTIKSNEFTKKAHSETVHISEPTAKLGHRQLASKELGGFTFHRSDSLKKGPSYQRSDSLTKGPSYQTSDCLRRGPSNRGGIMSTSQELTKDSLKIICACEEDLVDDYNKPKVHSSKKSEESIKSGSECGHKRLQNDNTCSNTLDTSDTFEQIFVPQHPQMDSLISADNMDDMYRRSIISAPEANLYSGDRQDSSNRRLAAGIKNPYCPCGKKIVGCTRQTCDAFNHGLEKKPSKNIFINSDVIKSFQEDASAQLMRKVSKFSQLHDCKSSKSKDMASSGNCSPCSSSTRSYAGSGTAIGKLNSKYDDRLDAGADLCQLTRNSGSYEKCPCSKTAITTLPHSRILVNRSIIPFRKLSMSFAKKPSFSDFEASLPTVMDFI